MITVRKKSKYIITALFLLLSAAAAYSQETPAFLTGSASGDVLLADLGGFGASFAGDGLCFLTSFLFGLDGETNIYERSLYSGITELSDIPLALSGNKDSAALSLWSGSLYAGQIISDYLTGPSSFLTSRLFWTKIDVTMYKAYASYAGYRMQSPAWDNSDFTFHGYADMGLSIFNPQNFVSLPAVLSVGTVLVSGFFGEFLYPDSWQHCIAQTGQWHIGNNSVSADEAIGIYAGFNLLVGISEGIGQEAVFRGFVHEELSSRLNPTAAIIIDTGCFALFSLFVDLTEGKSLQQILINQVQAVSLNLIFDWAYEKGGLPMAVSAHAWSLFASLAAKEFLTGGSPQSALQR